MDTGIATKKTNQGVLLKYVDNGDKKCRNETKRKLPQTQQTIT